MIGNRLCSGHAVLQNVETAANPSRLDLRERAHHKSTVRRHDQHNVKLLDWTLHMGYSVESTYRLSILDIRSVVDFDDKSLFSIDRIRFTGK